MDILAFLHDYDVPYILRGKQLSRGRIGINCPFCGDYSFHGAFTGDGKSFTCWKCGWHPRIATLEKISGLSEYELYDIIKEYDGTSFIQDNLNKKEPLSNSLELPKEPLSKIAKKYLQKRGFDPDYLEQKYHLRYGGIVGSFKYRIIIPIYENGVLVSYQGRSIVKSEKMRYKTLDISQSVQNPKHCLYNLDNALDKKVVVCEGPFDVMRIGDNCVGLLGTSFTEEQVRKLSIYKKVYIMFDAEVEAQKRAKKLGQKLSILGSEVEVLDIGSGRDPGELSVEEVQEIKKELGFVLEEA